MIWIKTALDWASVGVCCSVCGTELTRGQVAFISLDTTGELKVTEIRCPQCYHTSFPESI